MGIQSFVPAGGGGTPGFDYIASVNMTTFNRSWAQSGAAGNYVLTSNNNNSGYVYFTNGSSTTGGPLGKVIIVGHAFTTVNIIAPTGDFMSLYKASVKSTTVFANPFAAFASFPSTISSSGNFVLPTSALPLVDAVVVGGGGCGGSHHSGGGGGGGGVVTLTGYQAVGTTGVTIGGGGGQIASYNGGPGGTTYFGNVFALGGGGGAGQQSATLGNGVNGGGANGHNRTSQATGTGSNGIGTQSGTAVSYQNTSGGALGGNHAGGGGGGAGGNGQAGSGGSPGGSGAGHLSSIMGSAYHFGVGGPAGSHSPNNGHGPLTYGGHGQYGMGGYGAHDNSSNNYGNGTQGVVVVRYYIA